MLHAGAMKPARCARQSGDGLVTTLRGQNFCSVFSHGAFCFRGTPSDLTVARLLLRHLSQSFKFPLSRGVLFPATQDMGTRQRERLSGNAAAFAVMPHARRK